MSELVKRENHGGICIISLNRPDKLNAVDARLLSALVQALDAALRTEEDRVLLLRGEGRAFCAGNDLEAGEARARGGIDANEVARHAAALQSISRKLLFGGKPVVGAIHGWAVGAGFEWALNCDLTVWARQTRAFFPELSLGLFPTGGVLSLLPKLVGLSRAREMLLLGERYDAEALFELGIATRLVDEIDLESEAMSVCRKLLEFPAGAISRWKQAQVRALSLSVDETLDLEAAALEEAICATPR